MFRIVIEVFIQYFIENMDIAIKYGFNGFYYWHFFLVSIFYLGLIFSTSFAVSKKYMALNFKLLKFLNISILDGT